MNRSKYGDVPTGTVAVGIVFLNIYALADVGVGMVEIVIVSFAPELMMTGQHWFLR